MSELSGVDGSANSEAPSELLRLRDRLRDLPTEIRAELEPLLTDVMEQAACRGRVLAIARDALERYQLDLRAVRFDLEATRREREALRDRLSLAGA